MTREIFVFGSNLKGMHGAGSALEALTNHGAIRGKGVGPQGNSYAIPTKNHFLNVLPIDTIKNYVDNFIEYAKDHPEDTFNIVAIGCGLAGYLPEDIAPLFHKAPENCILPIEFQNAR
jgi:hypothetical protein